MDFLLARPQLVDLLEYPSPAPITLITAPAGWGKSTLVRECIARVRGMATWIRLQPKHNDTDRLRTEFANALPSPGPGEQERPGVPTISEIIDRLASRAITPAPLTIVLDDLHHITSNETLHELNLLLASRIPGIRWMILSRSMPHLMLSRLRAEGRVREIGPDHLRLTPAEVTELASRLLSRSFPDEQAEDLVKETDGWIAGIQLVLRAVGMLRAGADDAELTQEVAGEWIDTYVEEEVLGPLPAEAREILLYTCELPYLTPEIMNSVAETDAGKRVLALLERHHIVRRQSAEAPRAMEYARWIVASLQRIAASRLAPDIRAGIHTRTATFLLAHDQPALALEAALKTSDLALRLRIVRRLHMRLALEDRTVRIRELLETLPPPVIRQNPDLAYSYAHSLFHRGDSGSLTSLVAKVLPGWRESTDPTLRGYAMNCKGFVLYRAGDTGGALRHFREALKNLPVTQYRERLHALAGIFDTAADLGDEATAKHAIDEADRCRTFLPHHQVTWWMTIQPRLANSHALRGDLRLAGELLEYGLRNVPATFRRHRSMFQYLIAALRLEALDLPSATELIDKSLADVARSVHDDWHANALALGARIAHATGQHDLANERLREAHSRAARYANRQDLMQIETIRASWDIAQGNLVAARAWEQYWQPEHHGWIHTFGQLNAFATLLQLRVAEGSFDDAVALCDRALVEGERRQRRIEMISIMMWGVVAHQYADRPDDAVALLTRALGERGEEAISLAYATPGHDLAPYLRQVIVRHEKQDPALSGQLAGRDSIESEPTFPLTAREFEVVQLLALSLTNQEIGARLFVSEHTVKKHVSNILRKLQLPNRTAVVLHAREHGWTDA